MSSHVLVLPFILSLFSSHLAKADTAPARTFSCTHRQEVLPGDFSDGTLSVTVFEDRVVAHFARRIRLSRGMALALGLRPKDSGVDSLRLIAKKSDCAGIPSLTDFNFTFSCRAAQASVETDDGWVSIPLHEGGGSIDVERVDRRLSPLAPEFMTRLELPGKSLGFFGFERASCRASTERGG